MSQFETLVPFYGNVCKMVNGLVQKFLGDTCKLIETMFKLASPFNARQIEQFLKAQINQLSSAIPFYTIIENATFKYKQKHRWSQSNEQVYKLKEFLQKTQRMKEKIIKLVDQCTWSFIENYRQSKRSGLKEIQSKFTLFELNVLTTLQPYLAKQEIKQENQQQMYDIQNKPSFVSQGDQIFIKKQTHGISPSFFVQMSMQLELLPQMISNLIIKEQDLIKEKQMDYDEKQRIFEVDENPKHSKLIQLKDQSCIDFITMEKSIEKIDDQQKNRVYEQFLLIKNRLSNFKLFNSDKQFFKLCLLSQNQIKKIILRKSNKQLQRLVQKKDEMKQRLQIMSTKVEQTCFRHRQNVHYMCQDQYLKRNIYLCNQCILEIKHNQQHANHEIHCKRHRMAITHKQIDLRNNEFEEEDSILKAREYQFSKQQHYLCRQCIEKAGIKANYNQLSLLSRCHYVPYSHLCLEQQCIRKDSSLICPACTIKMHKDHEIVSFNKSALMHQFYKEELQTYHIYQLVFIDVFQRLKLNPIKKSIDIYVQQLRKSIKFLEAFLVTNNKLVEQWVDSILVGENEEDIYVLWGVRQLQRLRYGDYEKFCFLQVLNDLVSSELSQLFKKFKEILTNFRSRVEQFIKISYDEIENHLNKKYEKVINRQTQDTIIQQPCNLKDINPIHSARVNIIQVIKSQKVNNEQIYEQLKNQRIRFFRHYINAMFKRSRLGETLRKNIYQLLINQQNLYLINIEERIKPDEAEVESFQAFKQELNTYLQQYNGLLLKLQSCPQLAFLQQNKLKNLKIIKIQYPLQEPIELRYKPDCWKYYNYSISAFQLFRLISINKQLQQVSIKGIAVMELQNFIKQYRKHKEIGMTLEQQNQIHHQVRLKQYSIRRKFWKQHPESAAFLPQNLKISISGRLTFDLRDQSIEDDIEDLIHFQSKFKQVSDLLIEINVNFTPNQNEIFIKLLSILSRIEQIKLTLEGFYQPNHNYIKIFKQLTLLKSISQLSFKRINFSNVRQMQKESLEEYIRTLFENPVRKLEITECNSFPSNFYCQNLEQIILHNPNSRLSPEIITKSLKIKQLRIKDTFKQWQQTLENIQPQNYEILSLMNNAIDKIIISTSKTWAFIMFLELSDWKGSIDEQILNHVFASLQRLSRLYIEDISCSAQSLLKIPSKSLTAIKLWRNSQIANEGLQQIDSKWPYLTQITLHNCRQLDGRIFGSCKFRGLIKLVIDPAMLNESQYTLHYLKKRGIQVYLT